MDEKLKEETLFKTYLVYDFVTGNSSLQLETNY